MDNIGPTRELSMDCFAGCPPTVRGSLLLLHGVFAGCPWIVRGLSKGFP